MASTLRFLCKQIHWSLLSVFKVVSMCARTRWHGAFWFTSHSSRSGPSHPPRQFVATSASVRPVGSFEGKGGWTDHVAVLPLPWERKIRKHTGKLIRIGIKTKKYRNNKNQTTIYHFKETNGSWEKIWRFYDCQACVSTSNCKNS